MTENSSTSGNSPSTRAFHIGEPSPRSRLASSMYLSEVRSSETDLETFSPVKFGLSNTETLMTFQPESGRQTRRKYDEGSVGLPIASIRQCSPVAMSRADPQSHSGIPAASSMITSRYFR